MTVTSPTVRRGLLAATLAASLLLGGCGAMLAQNPSSPLKPVNAVAAEGAEHLMLKGHDVVAYFTQGRHALGSAAHQSVHQGVTFRFASAEHKALFDREPGRYLPQYGGYCANGIAYGIPWGGDPDTWKIIDGRLYIFGGESSRKYFLMDEKRNIGLADAYWKDEISGSHALPQRYKRLVMRVPHYRTGKELEQEWQAKQAPK